MNEKIVSTKLLPLMHFKNVSYFCNTWGNLLGKVPQNIGQLYLCPIHVKYCMVLS